MSERDTTSVLTDKQRAYLKGEHDVKNPREYDRRIRERVTAAMSDFAVLYDELEEGELRKIFGNGFAELVTNADEAHGRDPDGHPAFGNSMFAFAFLARALNLSNERAYPKLTEAGEEQIAFKHFAEQAKFGIEMYLREYHRQDVSASVTVDIETVEDHFPEHE